MSAVCSSLLSDGVKKIYKNKTDVKKKMHLSKRLMLQKVVNLQFTGGKISILIQVHSFHVKCTLCAAVLFVCDSYPLQL